MDLLSFFGDYPSPDTSTFGIIRRMGAAPQFPNNRVDTPEYRGHYSRGWKASQRGADGTLERADGRGEPNAWYDGYMDHSVGRGKFHALTCPSSEHEQPGCSDYDNPPASSPPDWGAPAPPEPPDPKKRWSFHDAAAEPGRYRFHGTCEYCDQEHEVEHFSHLGINVCDHCHRIHRDAIDAAEQKLVDQVSSREASPKTAAAQRPAWLRDMVGDDFEGFYHGTDAERQPGDLIHPDYGEPHHDAVSTSGERDWGVHFADTPEHARIYGRHVYQVEPVTDGGEPHVETRYGEPGFHGMRSRQPVRVVRRLDPAEIPRDHPEWGPRRDEGTPKTAAGEGPLTWDQIGERHPALYGDPEVHGEAAEHADGEGIGWAAAHLAFNRPGHDEEDQEGSWDLEFHRQQVPLKHIDYARHESGDSRVRHARQGYEHDPSQVPPLVLVHRHGVYQVADGHHRAEGAQQAGRRKVDAYVAQSPHEDEPFAASDGEPERKAPFHGAVPESQRKEAARAEFPCTDCGQDTLSSAPGVPTENYAVHNSVWEQAGAPKKAHLCVGCLETRLGRQLNRGDFPDVPVNDPDVEPGAHAWTWRSDRLKDRLRREAAARPEPEYYHLLQGRKMAHPFQSVFAVRDGGVVGHLMWGPGSAHTGQLWVDPGHRRQGIATAMWGHAQNLDKPPIHHGDRSDMGDAWAHAVTPGVADRVNNTTEDAEAEDARGRHSADMLGERLRSGDPKMKRIGAARKTGWGPSHWQHRDCGVYAKALTDADPSLRIGAVAAPHSDPATGHALHWFAHDDTHAYDSRGTHPLPYISAWDSVRNDYFPPEEHERRGFRQVLDVPVEHFGDLTEEQKQMLPAARRHIREHKVLGTTAAARPPRGTRTCECCSGTGTHGDGSPCTACEGLGHLPSTAPPSTCPGQPQPRRRHWRQAGAEVPDHAVRWLRGECGTYAAALQQLRPELKIGAMSNAHPDHGFFDGDVHYFAHDDDHAYDALGSHSLPYHGTGDVFPRVELGKTAATYGLPDEFEYGSPDEMTRAVGEAKEHAAATGVLGQPAPKRRHWRQGVAEDVPSIRMVPPEEYSKYHYPDYPVKTLPSLAKYFRQKAPRYYDMLKQHIAENGIQEPLLIRTHGPGGQAWKRPQAMNGHHRAAAAYELGLHMPVGDYDNEEHFDAGREFAQKWFSDHWQDKEEELPPWERHKPVTSKIVTASADNGGVGEKTGRGDYGMGHETDTDSAPLHDMLEGGVMPRDFYDRMHEYNPYQHEGGIQAEDAYKAMGKIRKFRGQPDKKVRIWRGAPAMNPESRNAKRGEINHGDWVGLSREKAIVESRQVNDPPRGSLPADHPDRYHIWTALVPAHHVRNQDGDITEWAYSGPDLKDLHHFSERCDHRARVPQREASLEAELELPGKTAASPEEYGIGHRPMETGAPMHDLAGDAPDADYDKTSYLASDYLTHPRYHSDTGEGNNPEDREAITQMRRVQGKPGAMVDIYRATHQSAPHEINTGDWVTLSKGYAEKHAYSESGNDEPENQWRVHHARVKAQHVRDGGGGGYREQGYWGPSIACCEGQHHEAGLLEHFEAAEMPGFEYPLAPGHLGEQGYRITDESRGYRHGPPQESWYTLHMTHPSGESHGHLDVAQLGRSDDPEREVHVQDLQTGEGHTGQGIASALMDHLYEQHPHPGQVTHSLRTDDGGGWWDHYTAKRPHLRSLGSAVPERESVRHILDHYKPTDFDTWDEVRDNHYWHHPKMQAFVEDVQAAGVQRPIPIDYEQDPPRVMNGHTRLLAAEKAGLHDVPVRQHQGFMDPDDPDPQGCHDSIEEHEQASPHWQHEASADDIPRDQWSRMPKHRKGQVMATDARDYMAPDLAARGHDIEWKHGEGWGEKGRHQHWEGNCRHCGGNVTIGGGGSSCNSIGRNARDEDCTGPGTVWQNELIKERRRSGIADAVSDFGQNVKNELDKQWLHGQGLEPEEHGVTDADRSFLHEHGIEGALDRVECSECHGQVENGRCRSCGQEMAVSRFPGARKDIAYPVVRGIEAIDESPGRSSEDDRFLHEHGIEGALQVTAAIPEYGPKPQHDWAPISEMEEGPEKRAKVDAVIADEHAWKAKIHHGLSVGHLNIDRAEELGYHASGHAHRDPYHPEQGWQPLPHEMYHVTTDLPGVRQHGLRTRQELAQGQGHGLGGGEDNTISLTTNRDLAQGILDSLHEYHHVLNHGSAQELWDKAKRGEGADRPFHKDIVSRWGGAADDWKDGDHLPVGLDATLRGKTSQRSALAGDTDEEMAAKGWHPSPHPENYHWDAPKGSFHTHYERDATPDEDRHNRSYLYKMFSHARESAGGREDPMFFSNNEKAFAAKDPAHFGLLHVRARPGAQGYPLGGMHEWRTGSGDALEVHHAETRDGTAHIGGLQVTANDDDRWQQAYNNAAERLYGKVEGDSVNEDEDAACIKAANEETADEQAHTAALQATAALENPYTGHGTWYHGTQAHPEEFEQHGMVDPSEFASGRFETPEGEGDDSGHWNRLLGNHFTADHAVAQEFARGEHEGASNEGYGDEDERHQGVIHAHLQLKNPKFYSSEHEMDHDAYQHEFAAGNHPINHLRDYEDDDEREEMWPNAMRIHRDYGDKEIPASTYGHYMTPFEQHPMRTAWLNTHPEKYEIAERFKRHLMDQGHDGIVYRNEYEKSNRGAAANTSVIAFHPHQVQITQHHHVDEPHDPDPEPGGHLASLASLQEPDVLGHFDGSASPWSYDTSIAGQVTARSPEGQEHVFRTSGTGLTHVRHHQDLTGPLYHGSDDELEPGAMIEPGHPGNFVSRMTHVYATEQPEGDESYKGARGYGRHVYEVRPDRLVRPPPRCAGRRVGVLGPAGGRP